MQMLVTGSTETSKGSKIGPLGNDVLDELAGMGIQPMFDHVPFRELTIFDSNRRAYEIRSHQPLWYLVRRGPDAGTLDQSLKLQANAAGANLLFKSTVEHLPGGGIVAHGPRRADVIAVGYVFETTNADCAYAVVSDDLAPKGYSYLLVSRGRATAAACLFADFHNEKTYLNRTVEFFRDEVGIDASGGKQFGGFGNVYDSMNPRRGNILHAGESAGLQDPLFGFGMRFALLSGSMAASAWSDRNPAAYDAGFASRFGPLLRLGWTNRLMYDFLGNDGYSRLLRRIGKQTDVRAWLRRYYTKGPIRSVMSRFARRRLVSSSVPAELTHENCDCTWCRCKRHRDDGHKRDA